MTQSTKLQSPVSPQATSDVDYARVRPRVDLLEWPAAWLLRAEMPGVDDQHVDVSIEQQVLTVVGTASVSEPEGFQREYGEFRSRRYERSFRLPEQIDRGRIEATMRHGVLTVTIPKAPEAQPTKVAVKGI